MNPAVYVLKQFELIWKTENKGRGNELRAVAAFDGPFHDIPSWFVEIVNANSLEDRAGKDVIVHTDMGKIGIQIKSCKDKAEQFKKDQEKGRYAKTILVVVIDERYTPEEVRRTILAVVIPKYHEIVRMVAECHGATFIAAA